MGKPTECNDKPELVSFPDPTLGDTPTPPGKGLEDRLGVTRILAPGSMDRSGELLINTLFKPQCKKKMPRGHIQTIFGKINVIMT